MAMNRLTLTTLEGEENLHVVQTSGEALPQPTPTSPPSFAAARALPAPCLLRENWVVWGREGLFIKLRKRVSQHIGTETGKEQLGVPTPSPAPRRSVPHQG